MPGLISNCAISSTIQRSSVARQERDFSLRNNAPTKSCVIILNHSPQADEHILTLDPNPEDLTRSSMSRSMV